MALERKMAEYKLKQQKSEKKHQFKREAQAQPQKAEVGQMEVQAKRNTIKLENYVSNLDLGSQI